MNEKSNIAEKHRLTTRLLADPYDTLNNRNFGGALSEDDFFDKENGLFLDFIEECPKSEDRDELESFIDELYYIRRTLKLSYIVGSSGCGKTTFLHYILRKKKTDGIPLNGVVFDMYASVGLSMQICQKTIGGSEIGINSLTRKSTKYKFLSVILEKINEIIDYNHSIYSKDNEIEKYRDFISKLTNRYNSRFVLSGGGTSRLVNMYRPFWVALADFMVDTLSIDRINRLNEDLKNGLIDGYRDDNVDDRKYHSFACYLLGLLTILKICEVDDGLYSSRQYKYLYAVDNIEYFISKDVVYDEDIVDIESIMNQFNEDFKKLVEDVHAEFRSNSPFIEHFKTVLVVRDSTNFLAGFKPSNIQEEDLVEDSFKPIDLTNKFSLELIMNKRVERLDKHNMLREEERKMCNTICQVLSDETLTYNSSKRALESMYNSNKRRTIIYLCSIFKNEDVRNEYHRLHDCCKSFEDNPSVAANIKYGYRSFVIRKLLDLVSDTSYFNEIIAVRPTSDDNESIGTGYARRILTVLNNYSKKHKNYCPFEVIASSLDFIMNDGEKEIRKVAEVLYKMNDSNIATTNWCQLVIINTKMNEISIDSLCEELLMNNETDGYYGVKITEAGKTLLRLMGSFEYFTCRYIPEYKSLFDSDNLSFVKSDGKAIFKAEKLIERVEKRVFKCIKHMKGKDDTFEIDESTKKPKYKKLHQTFDYEIGEVPHSHAYHIIQRQICDLEAYRCYLMSCYMNGNSILPTGTYDQKYQECMESLLNTIMKYIKELLDYAYELDEIKDEDKCSYIVPNPRTLQFFDGIKNKFDDVKIAMNENKVYEPLIVVY